MLSTTWAETRLDRHHPDLLLVRVRKRAARTVRGRHTPGVQALLEHERAGRLHHVLPLGRAARREVARRKTSGAVEPALRAAARELRPGARHTGYLLVHLKHSADREALHRSLARDPGVGGVSRVAARYLLATASADGLLPPERLWNHARIQLPAARALRDFPSTRRIRVAVLDSGVQADHPGLKGRVHEYRYRWEPGHPVTVSSRDIVGHGTHIAGIINALRVPVLGVEGIVQCRLTVMKVFDDHLFADPAAHARVFLVNPVLYRWALVECLAKRFEVVNLSLGGPAPPDPHEAALLSGLLTRGTVLVAAMGNALTQRSQPYYPAAVPGVIAVGAVGPDDRVAPFSRRGRHLALCAPGVAIWSTLPTFPGEFGFLDGAAPYPGERRVRPRPLARNLRYDAWPGTSGACPHVTAAVALLLASRGKLSPAQVKARLMKSADRVPGMRGKRFDTSYGAGRLNLKRLLAR